jgi:putative PLP-dependent aminotransferase (TIGR04422 family)
MTDIKIESKFIWPDAQFSGLSFFKKASPDIVEAEFKKLFPNIYPVLFSSARSGLVNLLLFLKANKLTDIWTPHYASHCVLEAISRVGFPTSQNLNAQIAIVYHQWGYKQNYNTQSQIIIEDSADSFFLPGNIVFPNEGNFQLASLPKSLGCYGGGILFCKSEEDAKLIREIRDSKVKNANLHFLLKLLGKYNKQLYYYWDSYESALGFPPSSLCADILKRLDNIYSYISQIKYNIQIYKSAGIHTMDDVLPDRLPCAIPLQNFLNYSNTVGSLIKEYRMFNTTYSYNNSFFEKVLPVPVHKDVNKFFIDNFLSHVLNPNS